MCVIVNECDYLITFNRETIDQLALIASEKYHALVLND